MAHLGNTVVNGALRVLGGECVDTINGVTVGSSPKFTDTTYTFATGDSNGQIKVTPSGGTAQNIAVKGLGSAAYTNSGTYVYHRGNAGSSNMNGVGRLPASIGMTNLSDPGNNYDNPMNGTTKATGWHLYYDASYADTPSGSNAWVSQIVNTAGTHKWWVRSRNGGTITDGTEWTAGWRHLVVSPQAGQGGTTTPIYVDANGHTQNCSYTIAKSVPSDAKFTDTTYGVVSSSANGLAPKVTDTSKFLKGDGTWATPTDTNTHRPIQVNGTEVLGNNTTALNLKAGSNVSLSNSSGTVTIAATDTTYNFSGATFRSGNQTNEGHDCNTSIDNGHYYYTSNGPSKSLGASTDDGALYSQRYSDSWVAQIAQDYRNGNLFTRGKNNGTWQEWRKLFYHGDTYSGTLTKSQVTTALGYTPPTADTNNAVTQTATTTSADYEVLFSVTADNTTRTEGARKNSNLKFNPSTGNLTVTKVNGESVKYTSSVNAVVGDTTCTISDSSIATTSLIEPFSSNSTGDTIAIKNIAVTAGQAVLTFKALTVDTSFKLRVTNV